ncbi:MAG: GNAT family N-acetyltransferase [Candidatus Nanopelagicales bacterium]
MGARFSLSTEPLTQAEGAVLASDLETLGADVGLLDLYAATLSRSSRLTRPRMLRMQDGDQLTGAALVMHCKDTMRSLFPQPAVRQIGHYAPASWYWERTGVGTDSVACPGLVAEGVDREAFARAGVAWLSRRYASGVAMQPSGTRTDQPHVVWPWIGVTSLAVDAGTRARIVGEHRHLDRKVRRFTGRGGRIVRLHGPMPSTLRPAMLAGYELDRPPDPPFRELYEDLVAAHWSIRSDDLVHLVAYVGDLPVGYHSFLRSGRLLSLLSGVFYRPAVGTHHAYENVLLGSIDLATDLGCSRIEYGAAINEVKRSLLDVEASEIHFVSRIPGVVAGLRAMLPKTLLASLPGRA